MLRPPCDTRRAQIPRGMVKGRAEALGSASRWQVLASARQRPVLHGIVCPGTRRCFVAPVLASACGWWHPVRPGPGTMQCLQPVPGGARRLECRLVLASGSAAWCWVALGAARCSLASTLWYQAAPSTCTCMTVLVPAGAAWWRHQGAPAPGAAQCCRAPSAGQVAASAKTSPRWGRLWGGLLPATRTKRTAHPHARCGKPVRRANSKYLFYL